MRTALAWKNLTHNLQRLAVAVSGVSFAVLLIFMEFGFLNALLESTVQIFRRIDGDLIVLSRAKYALPARERFDLQRVLPARGIAGVTGVYPVYLETFDSVLRAEGERGYPIRILAFHLDDPIFDIDLLSGSITQLEQPATAVVDVASRAKYQFPDTYDELPTYRGVLGREPLRLVGQFRLGVDFATDGNLIMSADNFARFFPLRAPGRHPLDDVDLAVIKLAPQSDREQVQRQVSQLLGPEVEILAREELIEREMNFWKRSAPVGYIFLVGVYVGFVVGVIICYQIIYSDIADHMREFATLKAMGYRNGYFLQLVLAQSAYLSVMGFVPSVLVTYGCYQLLAHITGLTMELTVELAVLVFFVTLGMCIVSGLLALRKLLSMDPASLF